MHIIFGQVNNWQVYLIKLLKYFKFKVFYLFVESKSEFENNKIANELKKKNIIPVPNEFGKNIPSKTFSLYGLDTDEISYKKNINMIPDKILKGYCSLFSINEKKVKKLRLMLQDVIGGQMAWFLSRIGTWSDLNPSTKIIFVNFKLINFFIPNPRHNIVKITIPIDILIHFVKFFKKIFLFFFIFLKKNKKHKNEILDDKNLDNLDKKAVALVTHKSLIYGTEVNKIFEKKLYYSEDINSYLHKYNILHLDYSDTPKPEKNICWISLNKTKFSNIQIFLKTLLASIQTIYLIRSWNTFLMWLLIILKYNSYIRYCEIIKKFKKLKIAIIDHDYLCPKTLILALEKNNVRAVATQDRFITIFYKSYYNVILDTYYVASEYIANVIKNSKYHDIKNVIPMGQYRSDYISLYKNKTITEEISKAKENGKKILIVLGYHSSNYQFQSYTDPISSWSAQMDFLEDCMKLAKNLNNTFMILRYKSLDWLNNNEYFENILNKINNCENIIISNRQNEALYGYKLCANADLIIAKHTSLADECLSRGIPVLFHEYTHNMQKIVLNFPNYLPPELICCNFEELLEKSKSLLFNSSSKLKDKISELNQTIYHVSEKGNIKNKIIGQLEKLISLT